MEAKGIVTLKGVGLIFGIYILFVMPDSAAPLYILRNTIYYFSAKHFFTIL